MKMPPNVDNRCTKLLDNEANTQIFKLLGNRCQSISTTVIQLYCTKAPNHNQWIKRETGVLCFVKDNIRKNYFFRLFCLKRNSMVWEHEMYNNIDYTQSTGFLHIFEGEKNLVAFNFADTEEARHLKATVDAKIAMKKRREKRRQENITQPYSMPDPVFKNNNDPPQKLSKRKRNLTKADIGTPSGFKHISHVGWNPTSGFDINSEDKQLTNFFQKAGVSEKQLQDTETRNFIYDFINRHGGREAVVEESNVARKPASTPPTGNQPQVPVPPIPPRAITRPPHVRAAPPPPPSPNMNNTQPPTRPSPPVLPPVERPAPPSLPTSGIAPPAPPPPPPPMDFVSEGPARCVTDAPTPMMSNNSELMESIRSGTTLKPASERKIPVQQDNSRGDLLLEIRKGFKLKPVDEREVKPVANVAQEGGVDLAGALARALHERSKAIHSEDDDDNDSEDFNDEDWD